MAKIPYMRFYPGDWLSDPKVRRLTWEQKGIYIDMLSLMWKNGENASLPDDPDAIASMLGIQKRKFLKIFRVFFEKNFEIFFRADGRIFQKRVLSEWEAASEKSQKATASARRRWENEDECERNANAMPTQCERNASHSSYSYSYKDKDIKDIKHMSDLTDNPLPKPPEKTVKSFVYPEEFENWWKEYPHFNRNKKGGYKAWVAALNGGDSRTRAATLDELQRAAVNYSRATKGKDAGYILHAATFLGPSERWIEFADKGKVTAVNAPSNDEYRLTDAQREDQQKKMEAFFAKHPELKEDGDGGQK